MRARLYLLTLLTFLSAPARAGGFAEHLLEAMRSNGQRMQGYARVTGGRSRALSQAWIAVGAASLPVAWYLDQRARPFQRAGISVMQLDFILMALTPAFSNDLLPPLPPSVAYPLFPRRQWRDRILELNAEKKFLQLHRETLAWAKEMAEIPRFHVLLRHMIESIGRGAYLAPQYEAQAIARGLATSPVWLSQGLINLQAKGLWAGDRA